MSGIKDYSTTAGSNNLAVPNGWPEGQAPSTVNNCARQNMADLRSWYEDAQWVNLGYTCTNVSASTFSIPSDVTTIFVAGLAIRIVDASTLYSTVVSSSYGASVTTVTVITASLTATMNGQTVSIGPMTPTNNSVARTLVSNQTAITSLTSADAFMMADSRSAGLANLNKKITYANVLAELAAASKLTATSYNALLPITASVAASALTVTLNACSIDFRNATLGSGTVTTVAVASPISVVVSSGSTVGTTNAVENRLSVIAINNAGTVELAVVHLKNGLFLTETNLITTIAEGGAGAADTADVIYSTTARASVAYRIVGHVESTQATAGTWATAPSKIQGAGGMAAISTAFNVVGAAPLFACRCWVNFNGTGTIAIRGSANVTSLTDGGAGNYTVNYTVAMPNINYCVNANCKLGAGGDVGTDLAAAPTTAGTQVLNATSTGSGRDTDYITVSVHA